MINTGADIIPYDPVSDGNRDIQEVHHAIDVLDSYYAPDRDTVNRDMHGHETLRRAVDQQQVDKEHQDALQLQRAAAQLKDLQRIIALILPESVELPTVESGSGGGAGVIIPNYTIEQTMFKPSSFQEVNALQAASLWARHALPTRNQEHEFPKVHSTPTFLLGARPVSQKNSSVLLASPARRVVEPIFRSRHGYRSHTPHPLIAPPTVLEGTMKTKRLDRVRQLMASRFVKYVGNATTVDELPPELDIAVKNQAWPNAHAKPIHLKHIFGLRTLDEKDLVTLNLKEYSVGSHLAELAIRYFDKAEEFKAASETSE